MNIIGILIVLILVISMIIGCVVGLVKGFTNVKSWGVEYLLVAAISIGIGGIFSQSAEAGGAEAVPGGLVTIILTAALVVGFTFLFKLIRVIFRKLIKNKLAKASEEAEEEETEVESETEDEDGEESDAKPAKKRKPSAGFIGFLNRILGGITLALKCFVAVGFASALLLFALDLTQFEFVTKQMSDLYLSATYLGFKGAFMDLFIVGIIMTCIKCGFNSGVSSALWSIAVLGLVLFSGLAAYHLAFNIPAFQPVAEKIAGLIATEGGDVEIFQLVGKGILTAGLFAVMLVAVGLISAFVPKIFSGLRDNKVFYAIDGVFGAICTTTLVLGILLGVGAVLQPICDLEFMKTLTSYFESSKIATYFYNNDLLALMGVEIPIRDFVS